MLPLRLEAFREIWGCDFEFSLNTGERPYPLCMVAIEVRSGRTLRLWEHQLRERNTAPFPIDEQSLFVAYLASAELGCFLELSWPFPIFVLDLYVEFRYITNGLPNVKRGLVDALKRFGLESISVEEKESMRALALRGGPYTSEEQLALLDYCQGDVLALTRLLPCIAPLIHLPHSLCRARFMKAIAKMEHFGVPLDEEIWPTLREKWRDIQLTLVRRYDSANMFDGISFKESRWRDWCESYLSDWPRLPSGRLSLAGGTFKAMEGAHPIVRQYREIRATLAELRLQDLSIGQDFRNRCLLSPFGAITGRNTPSSTKFIFGPARWIRRLIKPKEGYGLCYLDWEGQEIALASCLAQDAEMMRLYQNGDVYLALARQAKAAPAHATKSSHGHVRELFKQVALGTVYGLGYVTLAAKLDISEVEAKELLRWYGRTYKRLLDWADAMQDHGMLDGELNTVFGWRLQIPFGQEPRPGTLRNFVVQANANEMMRLAACLTSERGVQLISTLHDALLIEFPLTEKEHHIAITVQAMTEASQVILDGFTLRVEAKTVCYPDRFQEDKGATRWEEVTALL